MHNNSGSTVEETFYTIVWSIVEGSSMKPKSLEQAIQDAGAPIDLVWKPDAPVWKVPVIEPEYVGWSEEQAAWRDGVAISDLSHHMSDLFIQGPDAVRLLSDHSANNYEKFVHGQAKQFIPVTANGDIVTDGILAREGDNAFTLSGVPAAQSWIEYHALQGGYDVDLVRDPDSGFREGNPRLFRYQIQGPLALDLVAKVFGGPLPDLKFFHSAPVTLQGHEFRALRHGMAGQAGYEFIGEWEHAEFVKNALMAAGESFGLVHVGGMAYYTNGIESGWVPTPTPGIYTDPDLAAYRESLSVFSYEGQKPLHGSFFSRDIGDYYTSPYELGYGRSISFNHDFVGRDALMATKDNVQRKKVTLVWNRDDVKRILGEDPGFFLTYGRYRIESDQGMVGMTFYTGAIGPIDEVLSLSLVNNSAAEPGTEVTLVWGEHPGGDVAPDADLGFERIRATVQPSPYDEYARTQYRS